MKNKIIIAIIALVAITTTTHAQFYIEFNSGYAKGINNKKAFEEDNSYTNKDYYNLDTSNYSQYNMAQGFFIEPRVGYKITNWLSASVGFYYLIDKNNVNITHQNNDDFIDMYFVNNSTSNSLFNSSSYKKTYSIKTLFGFSPEIGFNKQFNKLNLQLNLGFIISKTVLNYSVDSIKTEYHAGADVSGSSGGLKKTTTNNYKHNLTRDYNITARIGLEISYAINKNISLTSKFYFNNLSFKPTNKETYYYYNNYFYTNYPSNTVGKNETEIDETVKEEPINGDTFRMNTLQFSFGVRYTFNKRKTE